VEVSGRDVNEQQFHDAWRGYNQEEVDDFLDQVAETIDRLTRENEYLRGRMREFESASESNRATEAMLKQTLLNAQQTAQKTVTEAQEEAKRLTAEAESRIKRVDDEVRSRMAKAEEEARGRGTDAQAAFEAKKKELDAEIGRLQAYESEVKRRLQSFLEEQLAALETLAGRSGRPKGDPPAKPRQGPPSASGNPAAGRETSSATEQEDVEADKGDQNPTAAADAPTGVFEELVRGEEKDEPPLDDFKPFDDEDLLSGRRRGFFRRRVEDRA
jgi:cell division initiation protein